MNASSFTHDVVCFGEILWDVLPDKSLPGGAPMNVAYHLKKLGANPTLISRIGNDERGRDLLALLQRSGIPTSFVQVDAQQETGWVHAWVKEHNEMAYDIVQPVAWDFIAWEPLLAELLAGAKYFVFGSLASRGAVSRETLFRLLEAAPLKVLDINLRPPHFSQAGVETLLQKADILKLNESELGLISGWYTPLQQQEDKVRMLQDRFSIPHIIVTLGSEGALVLEQGQLFQHGGIPVQVADTIGSGDAFLAGYLSKILKSRTPLEALRFACGLGALIATYHGACPDYNPEEAEKLLLTAAAQNAES